MGEAAGGRPWARVWTVGALVEAVAALLEDGFPACTVSGEIAGFARAASGHCYFTLKDASGSASLRCAMFRRAASLLDFAPAEGQRVELRGRLGVYGPRGELQFIAEAMRAAGAGALYERFLRLRARLESEGLFDAATKRPLPPHPRAIGIVTSLAGAALHDVATTLARRSPHVHVVVYPSAVQGSDAPAALCAAIRLAGERREVDVLVLCRGGGSLEDLWAFNDERVVRAVHEAAMHVVSGVGHETDVTLADLAADLRADTDRGRRTRRSGDRRPAAGAARSRARHRPPDPDRRRDRGAAHRPPGASPWCGRRRCSPAVLTSSTCSSTGSRAQRCAPSPAGRPARMPSRDACTTRSTLRALGSRRGSSLRRSACKCSTRSKCWRAATRFSPSKTAAPSQAWQLSCPEPSCRPDSPMALRR
jgi:hypothetical protein